MIHEPEEPGDSCSDNDSVWNGYQEDDIESPPDSTQTDDPATNGPPAQSPAVPAGRHE